MNNTLELMKEFESRNNISVSLHICTDGSCTLYEFWEQDEIKEFGNVEELDLFLTIGNLKMKDGRSISPIEILQ